MTMTDPVYFPVPVTCPSWCTEVHDDTDYEHTRPEDIVTQHATRIASVPKDEDGRTTLVMVEQYIRANGELGDVAVYLLEEIISVTPDQAEEVAAGLIKAAQRAREIIAEQQ